MICPKCGFSQPDDYYCAQCGVNVEKYVQKKRKKRFNLGLIITVLSRNKMWPPEPGDALGKCEEKPLELQDLEISLRASKKHPEDLHSMMPQKGARHRASRRKVPLPAKDGLTRASDWTTIPTAR
jgi:hypothetical protein